MPFVRSRFFGEVEYSDDAVVRLPQGLPPFVRQTRFLLLCDEHRKPLVFLQSVDEPDLCFITMPAHLAWPGYEPDLAAEHAAVLMAGGSEACDPAALTWLTILTVPESGAVTANLLAPVVVDMERRIGVQAVRADRRYSHAQPLRGAPGPESPC